MKYSIIPLLFALTSCSTVYFSIENMESPRGIVIPSLWMTNEGRFYDIPLLQQKAQIGKKYIPVRRVEAARGQEILVLQGGIVNNTDTEMTVRFKEFVLVAGGKEYPPFANNISKASIWAVGLGKRGGTEVDDGWDICLAYIVPLGTKPEKIVLGEFASIDVPINK